MSLLKRSSSPAVLHAERPALGRRLSVPLSDCEDTRRSKTPDYLSNRKRLPLQDLTSRSRTSSNSSLSFERKPPRPRRSSIFDGSGVCSTAFQTTEVRFLAKVNDKVWAAERDGAISIRNFSTAEVEARIDFKEVEFCWCLLNCCDLVWAGFSGGIIRVYSAETYQLVKELLQHAGGVYCLYYNSGYVYSGSNDFLCFQWNSVSFEFIRQFSGHKNSVRSIVSRGNTLITGSDDYSIRVWDAVGGEFIRELNGHRGGVMALAFTIDNQVWSGCEDGSIRVWNYETGELLHTNNEHKGRVSAFLVLGNIIWSSGVDRSVRCFAVDTYKMTANLCEHQGYINHLAFVGYSKKSYLWSCSNDKTIRVWESESDFNHCDSEICCIEKEEDTPLYRELEGKYKQLLDLTHETSESNLKQINEKIEEIRKLEATLQEKVLQLQYSQENLERSQKDTQNFEKELELSRKESQRLQQELHKAHQEFSNRHQEFSSEAERVQRLLSERDDLLSSTKNTLKTTQQALNRAQQDLNRCRGEAQAAHNEAQNSKIEAARGAKALQDETERLHALQRRLSEFEILTGQMQQELDKYRQKISRCNDDLHAYKAQVESLTEASRASQHKLLETEMLLKHTKLELDCTKEELKQSQKENADMATIGPLRTQVEELQNALRMRDNVIQCLKSERLAIQEGYSQLIQRKDDEMGQKASQLTRLAGEVSENGRRIAELLALNERKDLELASLSQQLCGRTTTEEQARQEAQTLINVKLEELRCAKSINETLTRQVADLGYQLEESKQMLVRERQARESSTNGIAQRDQELTRSIRKAADLASLLDNRTQELSNAHINISNLENELQSSISEQNILREHNTQMASELSELKQTLNSERIIHSRELSGVRAKIDQELDQKFSENETKSAELAYLSNSVEEYKQKYAKEHQISESLRARLIQTEKMAKDLNEQMSSQDDVLKQRTSAIQKADQNTASLQDRLALFEKEKEEQQRKIIEFEFVVQSRSELIRMIWDLFCNINNAKKHFKELTLTNALRYNTELLKGEAAQVSEDINEGLKINKRIVSNFFTDVEKYHLGISPYYFPADEDSVKARISEENIEGLRKYSSNELKRSGVFSSIRSCKADEKNVEKPGTSKFRSRTGSDSRS